MFYISGIFPKVKKIEKLDPKKQYIFCSNHTSILDVPFMFYLSRKPILFIGKKSIAKIPIFGYYYAAFNVLVDRTSAKNSYLAFQKAGQNIKEGKNMVIFPEGGIPKSNIPLNRFKSGAFRLAIEENVSIIPITFADNKWIFPGSYLNGKPGVARVTIHKEVSPKGKEVEQLKKEVFDIIESELITYEN
jgi:1-acyl-sn-glycerol-3-phosphate acyltransferase